MVEIAPSVECANDVFNRDFFGPDEFSVWAFLGRFFVGSLPDLYSYPSILPRMHLAGRLSVV